MSNRTYPRWGGIEHHPTVKGACEICGKPANRWGVVESTWFRSDDESYKLCPNNECRNELKRRHNVAHCP